LKKILQYLQQALSGLSFQYIRDWFQKMDAAQKRQFALLCTGIFALILTLSVVISLLSKDRPPALLPAPESFIVNMPIPAAELFLPDEPDFIPGILLQRDRRSTWTEEDAAEHWQDPLRFGEESWREKIETAIDEYLERIP